MTQVLRIFCLLSMSGHNNFQIMVVLLIYYSKITFLFFLFFLGVAGILEFSQNKKDGTYGVEIFLKNSNKNNLIPLTIPGCSQFCELNRLQELLKENIPQDWNEECKPLNEDFTAPPPSGP